MGYVFIVLLAAVVLASARDGWVEQAEQIDAISLPALGSAWLVFTVYVVYRARGIDPHIHDIKIGQPNNRPWLVTIDTVEKELQHHDISTLKSRPRTGSMRNNAVDYSVATATRTSVAEEALR